MKNSPSLVITCNINSLLMTDGHCLYVQSQLIFHSKQMIVILISLCTRDICKHNFILKNCQTLIFLMYRKFLLGYICCYYEYRQPWLFLFTKRCYLLKMMHLHHTQCSYSYSKLSLLSLDHFFSVQNDILHIHLLLLKINNLKKKQTNSKKKNSPIIN